MEISGAVTRMRSHPALYGRLRLQHPDADVLQSIMLGV